LQLKSQLNKASWTIKNKILFGASQAMEATWASF
jgi:hypothetical protein